jgi:hypothetical protein
LLAYSKIIYICNAFNISLVLPYVIWKYTIGNNNNNNNNNNKVKIKEFMYRATRNVGHEMYDYTSNNWSHWNSNEKLNEKSGSYTRKTFDRFTTKGSYTCNITHNTESTAV